MIAKKMIDSANYPDILGLITGGERLNLDSVQIAVATRPRFVRAGRPFEILLLVQNAVDTDVDITMTLHMPSVDAKKQKDRFIIQTQRVVVGVKPAEVGYALLTATTLPDVAISDAYQLGVEVSVKMMGKGERIRSASGGGKVPLEHLSTATAEMIEGLQGLTYHTKKRRMGNIIDVPFTLMSGTMGKMTDFAPGWVSLSRLSNYGDPRYFLHQYSTRLQVETLPNLKRALMLKPLIEATKQRFSESGFPLHDTEAILIGKLMTLILEYASPKKTAHGNMAARLFNIAAMIERDPFDLEKQPYIPHWFRAFMRYAEEDERTFSHPAQLILGYLYEDVIADAMDHAFALVQEVSGENLGDDDDVRKYRERVVTALTEKKGLDFGLVYLPLVMGGMIINEAMLIDAENPADTINQIKKLLQDRIFDSSDADMPIFELASGILARIGQKHGVLPV